MGAELSCAAPHSYLAPWVGVQVCDLPPILCLPRGALLALNLKSSFPTTHHTPWEPRSSSILRPVATRLWNAVKNTGLPCVPGKTLSPFEFMVYSSKGKNGA